MTVNKEDLKPGNFYCFENEDDPIWGEVAFLAGIDSKKRPIWEDSVGDIGENSEILSTEDPLFLMRGCKNFSESPEDFIVPVPRELANRFKHCDPVEFRRPQVGDCWISLNGKDVNNGMAYSLPGRERWIVLEIPEPEPEPEEEEDVDAYEPEYLRTVNEVNAEETKAAKDRIDNPVLTAKEPRKSVVVNTILTVDKYGVLWSMNARFEGQHSTDFLRQETIRGNRCHVVEQKVYSVPASLLKPDNSNEKEAR